MKNTLRAIYIGIFLILFMCLTLFYNFFVAKKEYSNVNINIKKGTTFPQIYKELKLNYGIVDRAYLKLNGGNMKLKVGTYKFNGKFSKYEIIKKQKTILIKINEDFKFLLNKFISNFTRFELNEFISLKSSYSKEIYRRLKQFKHTGMWKVQIDNFRELLNIPEKYRISEIDKKVFKISIEELNKYFDNFEIIKIKKGRKIEYLEFKFSPEKKHKEKISGSKEEPIRQNKSQKRKGKISEKIVPERKSRIIEAPPKIEKEKTLREKIWDKINENTETIENLEAIYTGLKDKIQFKKLTEKYPQKIEKIKNMNMQLKAIYNIDENDFTQEIIELAEDLIIKK